MSKLAYVILGEGMGADFWTGNRVEELERLWADGLSGAEIARRMGASNRNVIISKAHRMGLTRIKIVPMSTPLARIAPRRQALPSIAPVMRAPPPPPLPDADIGRSRVLAAQAAPHRCRWPIGDPRLDDFGYCDAARTSFNPPYCDEHLREKRDAKQPRGPVERLMRGADRNIVVTGDE